MLVIVAPKNHQSCYFKRVATDKKISSYFRNIAPKICTDFLLQIKAAEKNVLLVLFLTAAGCPRNGFTPPPKKKFGPEKSY